MCSCRESKHFCSHCRQPTRPGPSCRNCWRKYTRPRPSRLRTGPRGAARARRAHVRQAAANHMTRTRVGEARRGRGRGGGGGGGRVHGGPPCRRAHAWGLECEERTRALVATVRSSRERGPACSSEKSEIFRIGYRFFAPQIRMARLLTLASLAHLAVSSAHPRACSANATGGPIDVWSAVDTWKHCHFIDVGDYIHMSRGTWTRARPPRPTTPPPRSRCCRLGCAP